MPHVATPDQNRALTQLKGLCFGVPDGGQALPVIKNGSTTVSFATKQYMTTLATPVIVAWQSADLSLFSGRITSTTASPTSSASPASTLSAPTPSPSLPQSTGFTKAQTAGIGVGAAVGGLALLSLLGLWLWRRSKRQPKADGNDLGDKPELSGEGVEKPRAHVEELGQEGPHEMTGVNKPSELGHGDAPAELDANWHGHEAPADAIQR